MGNASGVLSRRVNKRFSKKRTYIEEKTGVSEIHKIFPRLSFAEVRQKKARCQRQKLTVDYGKYHNAIISSLLPEFKPNLSIYQTSGDIIKKSWSLIIHGKTERFIARIGKDYTLDPVAFFTLKFFKKLFKSLPRTKALFAQDPHQRYKKLDEVVRLFQKLPTLSCEETKKMFCSLIDAHRKMKVRTIWYGEFLMRLAIEVEIHMGEACTPEIKYAWLALCSHANKELLYADFDSLGDVFV